jgi:hypothetical protein
MGPEALLFWQILANSRSVWSDKFGSTNQSGQDCPLDNQDQRSR